MYACTRVQTYVDIYLYMYVYIYVRLGVGQYWSLLGDLRIGLASLDIPNALTLALAALDLALPALGMRPKGWMPPLTYSVRCRGAFGGGGGGGGGGANVGGAVLPARCLMTWPPVDAADDVGAVPGARFTMIGRDWSARERTSRGRCDTNNDSNTVKQLRQQRISRRRECTYIRRRTSMRHIYTYNTCQIYGTRQG